MSRAIRRQVREVAAELVAAVKSPGASRYQWQGVAREIGAKVRQRVPDATERQAVQAAMWALSQRFGPAPRGGSASNFGGGVFTDEEMAFIEAHYGGAKAKAIHDGLALLIKCRLKRRAPLVRG